MKRTDRRVAFLCAGTWTGGPATFVIRSVQGLQKRGWKCRLFLTSPRENAAFPASSVPCDTEWLPVSYSWQERALQIAKALHRWQPEVLVACPLTSAAPAVALLRGEGWRLPFIETLHTDWESEYGRVRDNAGVVTVVACVSDAMVTRCRDIVAGVPVERFFCPVPIPEERNLDNRPLHLRIAHVGTLAPKTRALDMLPVMQRLCQSGVQFSISVIGDGHDGVALKAALDSDIELRKRTTWHGWVPPDRVSQLLMEEDALLLLSESEGQPFRLVEAMACGVVPVATALPGNCELIRSGTNGFLRPVGDLAGFACDLERLAKDRELLALMGAQARRTVQARYSISAAAENLERILESAIQHAAQISSTAGIASADGGTMARFHVPERARAWKRRMLRQEVH